MGARVGGQVGDQVGDRSVWLERRLIAYAHQGGAWECPSSTLFAIERALAATHGERGRTAEILGIGRTTLYRKMKQYKLDCHGLASVST